jgi:hypothetical protein
MGAWGHRAFDNDTANDWACDLEDLEDLSLVEAAFTQLEEVGSNYLDQDIACNALAACEVLARCLGQPGYTNAYTEKVDAWVAVRRLKPSPSLLARAATAIDRVLGQQSELRDLWEDAGGDDWRRSVGELRQRLQP